MPDVVEVDGKHQLSKEFQVKRTKLKYASLFPFPPTVNQNTLTTIKERLSLIDFSKTTVITCPQDIMKPCFLYGLLSLSREVPFVLMSAYHLIDIMVGNTKDEEGGFTSIGSIDTRVVGMYLGFSEMENRRQSDVIEQIFSLSSVRGPIRTESAYNLGTEGQAIWLFYLGNSTQFSQSYPKLANLIPTLGFNLINIDMKSTTVSSFRPTFLDDL